jgi:hypothetical protein
MNLEEPMKAAVAEIFLVSFIKAKLHCVKSKTLLFF